MDNIMLRLLAGALGVLLAGQAVAGPALSDILKASPTADWQPLDPENTLYLDLPAGRVVILLAPTFAPRHIENIKKLVRSGYFDGLAIMRVQDNYVVQWGDADAKRSLGKAAAKLQPEFDRRFSFRSPFTPAPDPDVYAPQSGFVDGFAVARDAKRGRAWLTHCYGAVGVGRDNAVDSGNGAELYAVIGNAPRQLDRNVTLVGRVVLGMERLSALPRGTGDLGFYETPGERIPIIAMKLAADTPATERTALEALRTNSKTFAALIYNRRFRQDEWYKTPAGHIDLCNLPLPVRPISKSKTG